MEDAQEFADDVCAIANIHPMLDPKFHEMAMTLHGKLDRKTSAEILLNICKVINP